MPRIPYPDPDTLSEAKRAVLFGKGPVLNLTRMAMHAPEVMWDTYRKFAVAGRDETGLDDVLRELLILRVGYLSNSPYEVHHHLHVAIDAGATEAQLDAVRTGDLSALEPHERAALRLASQLIRDVAPDDATLRAALEHFAIEQVFGILMLCCGYMTTARIIALSGIEPETD
jgi:alkylhydroperoxidase family enzyme